MGDRNAEDHTEGFRRSPEYRRWQEPLHRFYDPFPRVEHYEAVPGQQPMSRDPRPEE